MTRFDMFSWLDKKKHDAALTPTPAVIPNEPTLRDVPQPDEALTSTPASTPDVTSTPLNFAMPAATQSGQSTPEPIIPETATPEPSQAHSEQQNGTAQDPIEPDADNSPAFPETVACDEAGPSPVNVDVSGVDADGFDSVTTHVGPDVGSKTEIAPQTAVESGQAKHNNGADKELFDSGNETMLPVNEHPRIIIALTKGRREPKPTVGMPAFELAAPRLRAARVLSVKAGGQRVTALIIDTNRSYTYALQKDGTYRLEGVPAKSAPRLLLNLEV